MIAVVALAQGVKQALPLLDTEAFSGSQSLALKTDQPVHDDFLHLVGPLLLSRALLFQGLELDPLIQAVVLILAAGGL